MEVRTGPEHYESGAGFTLVELLLAVGLVMLLLGAVVFNFSSLQRTAPLDEGVNQIEALLRFARAHAASSGRQVQITFEEDFGDGLMVPVGNLSVLWEPDPLGRPGYFEPVTELQEYVHHITDLVSIESVHFGAGNSFKANLADDSAVFGESAEGSSALSFPPIGFFPDGSSDSAEIIVASRADEDTRRIAVQLQGITGSIRRQLVTDELKSEEQESPIQAAPAVIQANTTTLP